MDETQGVGGRPPGEGHVHAEPVDAEAQAALGEMYENGRGVLQDWHQAVEWYRKAAAQGHARAQARLNALAGTTKLDAPKASSTRLAEKALANSNRVRVIMDDSIRWPDCCAQCGGKKNLTTTAASITAVDSVNYFFVVMSIKTRKLKLTYPVCSDHQALAYFAGLVIHPHPVLKLIRFFIYLFLLAGLISLFRSRSNSMGLGEILLLGGAFLAILWGRKSTPIRIAKWDEGVADIVFRNTNFARQFIRLNPELTDPELAQRLPWYSSKYWGAIALVASFSLGMLLLIVKILLEK